MQPEKNILSKKVNSSKVKLFGNYSKSDIWILVFILAIALFLRLWQITTLPVGVSAKEIDVINKITALKLTDMWLGGKFDQGAYIYTAFIAIKLFGLKVITLRVFSAIVGTLTVLFGYIFISQWFSKKVAAFSGFLFAVSFLHVSASRVVFPQIMLPLALLALFSVLTEAYRRKNIWLFGAGGAILGLGFYTSPVFIMIPFLFIISGVYFFIKNKKFITNYKQEILIGLLGFLTTAIPFLVSFAYHPNDYLTYFGFHRSFIQFLMNIGDTTQILFVRSSTNNFLNIGNEPIFDPFVFVSALTGLILALSSITRRKYFFLISWTVIFALYAALKRGTQIDDLFGLLPVFFTFSALILDYVLDMWFATFPLNKRAKLLAIGLISIFFALSALYNFDRYFVAYKNSELVKKEFSAQSPIPLK